MNADTDFLQAERILRIETPLGADLLLAQKLTFREAVSELFEGRVAVRAKTDLDPADLLGKPVDVSIELGAGARRIWNAIVTDLIAGPRQSRGLRSYELVLRPDLWLLSQTSDCRIWRDRTALEVAEELCAEHGLAAPATGGVIGPVPAQHYSVQWNETDLDYLKRRLEEDGLFFWWAHEAGRHRLQIASHAAGYRPALAGDGDVRFAAGSTDRNHIGRFETRFSYTPGVHAGADWNFETPGGIPSGNAPSLIKLPRNGNYERFEYPVQAGYGPGGRASEGIDDAGVERVARLRMQAIEAEHARIEGESRVRTLAAGHRFTPYDVANPENTFAPHAILAIVHEAVDTSYESIGNQPEYTNRFVALPADVPATPRRTTPQPRIDGAQVAIVAGPPGEEIHPDEYGRIKLWFPWDRRAAKDGSDTCWVRVTQNWAGAGWGGQVIPRIGMEVMVTYLDGDPDRPVVTGVVPNARQVVPYGLPGNKTRSTFRTNTHKGEGFNELRFEDEIGREEVFVHAQRDRNEKTLHNHTTRIDNNYAQSVGHVASEEVEYVKETFVGGNYSIRVGNQQNPGPVANARRRDSQGIGAYGLALGERGSRPMPTGNFSMRTEGNQIFESDRNIAIRADGAIDIISDEQLSVQCSNALEITTGKSSSEAVGGRKMITAGDVIQLKCGRSSLTMKPSGEIVLSGTRIAINAKDRLHLSAETMKAIINKAIKLLSGRIDLN